MILKEAIEHRLEELKAERRAEAERLSEEFVTPEQVAILKKLAKQDFDDYDEESLQAVTWWHRKGRRMTAAEAQDLINHWDELTDQFYAMEDDFDYHEEHEEGIRRMKEKFDNWVFSREF